ncbi:CRISPR-associated endonuclease Cas2 [Methanosarcina barkeri]|nr:CRISPR-associated endonuclease Cas2 [Methanosarcina barkeri]
MSGLNCYIVSYDIKEPTRLRQVHNTVEGFGSPLHYSVFRCDLSKKSKVELIAALTDIINSDEDSVMIINLGPANKNLDKKITFIGQKPEVEEEDFIIV